MNYRDEMTKAMTLLSENPKTLFIGQGTRYPGHGMFSTLKNVPMDKRIEFPVAEELQMGVSIGLSLQGFIPISLYPRMDFLLLAMNQLVNHLDKIDEMSGGEFKPKVIIRTSVGSKRPLDPGLQHSGDYAEAIKSTLKNIVVITLKEASEIVNYYRIALDRFEHSTILIEYGELYDNKPFR